MGSHVLARLLLRASTRMCGAHRQGLFYNLSSVCSACTDNLSLAHGTSPLSGKGAEIAGGGQCGCLRARLPGQGPCSLPSQAFPCLAVPGCRRGRPATCTSGAGHPHGHTQEGISHVFFPIKYVATTGIFFNIGSKVAGKNNGLLGAWRRSPPPGLHYCPSWSSAVAACLHPGEGAALHGDKVHAEGQAGTGVKITFIPADPAVPQVFFHGPLHFLTDDACRRAMSVCPG